MPLFLQQATCMDILSTGSLPADSGLHTSLLLGRLHSPWPDAWLLRMATAGVVRLLS